MIITISRDLLNINDIIKHKNAFRSIFTVTSVQKIQRHHWYHQKKKNKTVGLNSIQSLIDSKAKSSSVITVNATAWTGVSEEASTSIMSPKLPSDPSVNADELEELNEVTES